MRATWPTWGLAPRSVHAIVLCLKSEILRHTCTAAPSGDNESA